MPTVLTVRITTLRAHGATLSAKYAKKRKGLNASWKCAKKSQKSVNNLKASECRCRTTLIGVSLKRSSTSKTYPREMKKISGNR